MLLGRIYTIVLRGLNSEMAYPHLFEYCRVYRTYDQVIALDPKDFSF